MGRAATKLRSGVWARIVAAALDPGCVQDCGGRADLVLGWCNSGCFLGVGEYAAMSPSLGVHCSDGCWLHQWQELLVQDPRLHTDEHYGALSCENYKESAAVAATRATGNHGVT